MPFLQSTAVSGKGPSQPAPRFIGNLIAYILNLVSVALLETTDWHHSETIFLIIINLLQIGPKGLEFARYSLDYHTIRNYLYVMRKWGKTRY